MQVQVQVQVDVMELGAPPSCLDNASLPPNLFLMLMLLFVGFAPEGPTKGCLNQMLVNLTQLAN